MKTNEKYKITVLSVDDKIEAKFHHVNIAIDTIMELKKIDKGFLTGILEEKIDGEWRTIWFKINHDKK